MSTTERERCPTCDHETAEGEHHSWSATPTTACTYPPVDWRQRCLAAEAQLAGVRPLVEARRLPLRDNEVLVQKLARVALEYTLGGWGAGLARAMLAAVDAHERTEGRAGDGPPQATPDKDKETDR